MESSTIALIGLVLGLIGAIVGSFAYLMGEIRKVGATAQRNIDNLRDYVSSNLEQFRRNEAQERASLRTEFVTSTGRIEADLKRLSEQVVRRSDVEQLETRLTRSTDRLEAKFDNITTRLGGGGFPRPGGGRGGSD